MILSSWPLLGLLAAMLVSFVPLLQEKFKADGFSVAFWIKVVVIATTLPFVIYHGLPDDPKFYPAVALTSLLWCISDVVYFRAVPAVGAGVISRLLPASVIITFVLWLFVDPSLLHKYLDRPWQAMALVAIILCSVVLSVFIRKCPVSWDGARRIWFVIFAACIGPIIDKISLGYAPAKQAPFAYMLFQASFMVVFWLIYYAVKKPVAPQTLLSPYSIRVGGIIGLIATVVLYLKTQALLLCDHPAYLSVLFFTDSLWILLVYRLVGRKDHSNVGATLGLVACAAALILVKNL